MIISIIFFIVAYLVGYAIIKLCKLDLENIIHPTAMLLGLVFLCLLFYLEGLVFGSLGIFRSLITLMGLIVITGVVLRESFDSLRSLRIIKRSFDSLRSFRMTLRQAQGKLSAMIIQPVFILFIIWFFGRSLFFGTNGEIIAGDRLVWTDWPLHIGMTANFAYGANFPPQNPHFSGIALTYPFMSDFLSGILLSFGTSLPMSFVIPGIVLTLTFFWIFVEWVGSFWSQVRLGDRISMGSYLPAGEAGRFSGKAGSFQDDKIEILSPPVGGSRMTILPYGALIISLLWGGLGWIYWLKDVFANETQMIENLLFPPREYTFWSEKGQWFYTFLYSEILPQRAFLFGLPLFFLILWLVKKGWDIKQNKYLFAAGILGGLLPFFHTHTFISLWMLSGSVVGLVVLKVILNSCLRRQVFQDLNKMPNPPAGGRHDKLFIKSLISFFTPFLILTLIQLPVFSSKTLLNFPISLGWMKDNMNFFLFWAMNTGLFIPLWFLGFWKGKFSNFTKIIGLASWILFILPNLFQFAPWGYDNLKIFTFWYVIGSVFVVAGLRFIWQIRLIRPIGGALAGLLFVSLTLSGVLEITRLTHTSKTQITLWNKQDVEFAQIIRQKTSPQAIFLTAAIHDHPIEALAGRKIILGYPGNSWSWGIEGWDTRERDVHIMLQGGDQAKILWKKYAINYIIVSDRERWFEPKLNEEFIAENTDLVLEKNTTKLYKIK